MFAPSIHAGQETLHGLEPVDVLRRWPAEVPLAVVCAGPRWTVLARPGQTVIRRAGESLLPPPASGEHAAKSGPFSPGWAGQIAYEAGGIYEPTAGRIDAGRTLAVWRRCDDLLVHDRVTGTWTGHAPGPSSGHVASGELEEIDGRERYIQGVRCVIERIRAGDIYQANLAHRLQGTFNGSARRLFTELLYVSGAWHGAFLEWDEGPTRRASASASPELFLKLAPDGRVVTRPMKGTARASAGTLEASDKDRAELNMIVDLMRNDLGRVCRFGSVRVDEARAIETHGVGEGALHQGVATVSGTLRDGLGLEDLIRASFPGGSITGAPKVRAMQIINELEGFERGAFCGAIGYVGDDGSATLGIGIRTASIEGAPVPGTCGDVSDAILTYPVGAGIVVDSDPDAEWRETLDKSRVIRAALDRLECAR